MTSLTSLAGTLPIGASTLHLLLWGLLAAAALWGLFIVALIVAGRHAHATAVARLVPDLVVLFKRLLGDRRVPRRGKLWLALTLVYLVSPLDLVPDFVPVAGQLDDAIIVGFILRHTLRTCPPAVIGELWPGPQDGLQLILRLSKPRGAPR